MTDIPNDSQLTTIGPQRFNWTGLNPSQMKSVAQAMSLSGMFPDIQKDSAKAFVKIMAGQEMGIPPFQAMSDISIIQGKAAAGGNIYAAKVKSSGRYDYRVKRWDREGCEIEFLQRDTSTGFPAHKWDTLGVSSFTGEDAKDAGLLGKDSWKRYPRNMYFNRAMTAGVRTFCPDALNGVNAYTPEELGSEVDEDGRVLTQSTASFPQAETPVEPVENSDLSTGTDEVADVSDTDLVELAAQQAKAEAKAAEIYKVPKFPASSSNLMHPAMGKRINAWLEELGYNDVEVATFMQGTIMKEKPTTYDEAIAVLEGLAFELNVLHAAREAA